jgi:hypothetical protein
MIPAIVTPRVIYVGTGRRRRSGVLGLVGMFEHERCWRERLAKEMETVCEEMQRRGLRLKEVVPVLSAESFKGSWTEGAWLVFTDPAPA